MASLVTVVKTYAKANYSKGWDIVVEAMTDEEIGAIVNKADTEMGAKRLMSKYIKARNAYAADIAAA